MIKDTCVCVVGWHFIPHVYERLFLLKELDLFVVSHRSYKNTPRFLNKYILNENIFYERNFGYDWGAYQQFLEKGIYNNFKYIFFLHDDLVVLDLGFVQECINLLNKGYHIIGNARHEKIINWPKLEPWSYSHSGWKPPAIEFCHECIRGSFFATTSSALNKIVNFEVFWDRFKISENFGNWSTKATCGKFKDIFGEQCFAYLSENPRKSKFIIELSRGELFSKNYNKKLTSEHNIRTIIQATTKRIFIGIYRRICGIYVKRLYVGKKGNNLFWKVVEPLILWPSKC